MEVRVREQRKTRSRVSQDEVKDDYSQDANLYLQPPDGPVNVEVLKRVTLDRAKLLKIVDTANDTCCRKFSKGWWKVVEENLDAEGLRSYAYLDVEDKIEARRHDHISHYTLMLAFHGDDRSWFVDVECDLFQLRLLSQSEADVAALIERHRDLFGCTEVGTGVYKLPFTDVPNLIRSMSVELAGGYAFVPTSSMHEYVTGKFRTYLWERLKQLRLRHSAIDEPRILPILDQISVLQLGRKKCAAFQTNDIDLDIADIEDLAQSNYPLCMRAVHEALKKDRHLKHGSRMQYLYFLYGCGYGLDEVLEFWRANFTGSMDDETFEKKYSYFVKHTFGAVGRRRPARPLNCEEILSEYVAPGQKHGCPFKVWSRDALEERLKNDKIRPHNRTEIVDLCLDGQHQQACGNYFQRRHGTSRPNIIVHPNQYFVDSLRIRRNEVDVFEDLETVEDEGSL